MMRWWVVGLVMMTVGCQPAATTQDSEPTPAVAMSSSARWAPVRSAKGRAVMELAARVVADVEGEAEVTALYPGQVLKVLVQPGDHVDEGAAVVHLAVPELSAAVAQLASSTKQLELLQARAKALTGLRQEGLARQGEVFEVQTRVAELQAEQGLAQAKVRSAGLSAQDRRSLAGAGYLALRSPVEGVVTDVHLRLGQTVNPDGRPLVQVRGRGSSRVEAQLPSPLPEGAAVEFLSYDGQTYPIEPSSVAEVLDPESGTLRAWLQLKQDRLPSGLRGTVVVRGEAEDWFEVPSQAVVLRAAKSAIFIRRGDKTSWQTVEPRVRSGAIAVVQGNLQEGDEVLADGQAPEAQPAEAAPK